MRRIFILLIILALPMVGCVERPVKVEVSGEADSLKMVILEKDSLLESVFISMGDLAANLNRIKEREDVITSIVGGEELAKEPLTQIEEDIGAIDKLLLENRNTIARLNQSVMQLKSANHKVGSLEKLVEQMNQQSELKDREIAKLKSDLKELNLEVEAMALNVEDLAGQVDDLTQSREELKGEIREQSDLLNTAYYIVGSRKELLDKEIIYKSGFIGRTLKVNENRSLEAFVGVDRRIFDEVIIGYKSVDIVTSHPDDSYEFVMNDSGIYLSLVITDKERFWEYSKVLVISHK